MTKTFYPHGVCSRRIDIELEDNIIKEVTFTGGCSGNTQGISALVTGLEVKKVISLLRGINCGGKGTSCPDQLACALEEVLENKK